MADSLYTPIGQAYGGFDWQSLMATIAQMVADAELRRMEISGWVTPREEQDIRLTETEALHAIYNADPAAQVAHENKKSKGWSITKFMRYYMDDENYGAAFRAGAEWVHPTTGVTYKNTRDLTATEYAVSRGYSGAPTGMGEMPVERVRGLGAAGAPPPAGMQVGPPPATIGGTAPAGMQFGTRPATVGRAAGEPAVGEAEREPWEEEEDEEDREPTLAREIFEYGIEVDETGQENWQVEVDFRQDRADEDDRRQQEQFERTGIWHYEAQAGAAARNRRRDWEWDQNFARQNKLDVEDVRQFNETHRLNIQAQRATEERTRGEQALGYMQLQTQTQGPRDWLKYGALQRQAQQTQFPEWARRLAEGLGFAPFQGGAAMPPPAMAPAQMGPPAEILQQYQQLQGLVGAEQAQAMLVGQLQQTMGPMEVQGIVGQLAQAPTGPMPGLLQAVEQELQVQQTPAGMPPTGLIPETSRPPVEEQIPGIAPAMTGGWQDNLMQQAMSYIQPHTISASQWADMLPSEREQLAGLVEAPVEMGGYAGWWDDYYAQMQAAWPTGDAVPVSRFAGW